MLGCGFTFEVYGKNVTEQASNYSLKTTDVLLGADRHMFIKVQDLQVVFESHTYS